MSVEQYHLLGEAGLLGENVELLEGVVVEKMPKSPLHVFYTEELVAALHKVLTLGYLVREEKPITCDDSEPELDIALVRGRRTDFLAAHPTTADLVIEVSVSNSEIDHQKRKMYATAGILEYWIVLPVEQCASLHRTPRAGLCQQAQVHGSTGHHLGSVPEVPT